LFVRQDVVVARLLRLRDVDDDVLDDVVHTLFESLDDSLARLIDLFLQVLHEHVEVRLEVFLRCDVSLERKHLLPLLQLLF